MLSYEKHFKSNRPDGRFVSSLAAYMEQLRHLKPELSLPAELTPEVFSRWQKKVAAKVLELLQMPEMTEQPDPVMLSSVQRDTYRVEKWEFYPDDYTAVPFLILIPDKASAENPVPAVLCFLGSNHNKEFVAGEALYDHPNCQKQSFPDRNPMAVHFVKAGMCAIVFDNLEIGECSVQDDPQYGETQWRTRTEYCFGLLHGGYNYLGITVFQKLCAMKFLKTLPYIKEGEWAIAAHSLGTEPAIAMGLLLPEIKAVIFNDFLHDDRRRFVAITEEEVDKMHQDIGNWHVVPGVMRYFAFQDLCAAFAPRYLALNEGGAEEMLAVVERAYKFCGAEENLSISFYPAFADPATRTAHGKVPMYGLTRPQFYKDYSYVVVEDHSFRVEPSVALLKKCFGLQ